ncbi:Metallo-dependent phosphatase-like protein [Aspergillus tamarii]|uniref:Purple acid phosphatase n=1 Tax=Aspergillus tamarii TaxID=41984 RepID=A0A5N6V3F6_ASPTM|nr:Metallo-dependent phosphatase-like protein [Aspergillus tamarii]
MLNLQSLGKVLPFLVGTGLAAVSYPPIPEDLTTPYQQRLAIYGPNAISVGWNTYEKLNQSCVQYGTSKTKLDAQACSSTSSTYATSRTYSNAVVLTGLTPATTYYYKIVSTNSSVDQFLSPRSPGDTTPFNLDVVIDLGVFGKDGYTITSNNAKKSSIPSIDPELNHTTIGRLAETVDDYEFVLHPGDFAYADDWYLKPKNLLDGKDAYQAILEQFYDQLAPISGRKPYLVSPGNHEAACGEIPFTTGLCPLGQRNFTAYMHRYDETMPSAFTSSSSNTTAQSLATKAQSLAQPPFWYSFEYGMAHIVMINTETDFPSAPDGQDGSAKLNSGPFGRDGQQLAFLEADLASVDRTVTPWVIVAGHRPWYSTGSKSNICEPCQEAFEELFYKYGVDLGVFGHVHNSQRFLPVYNNKADPNGMNDPAAPMYIVAGGAGNIEGLSSVGSKPSYTEFVYADDYSYSTLRILDANNLQVDFIRSSTGEVLDSSKLYKSHKEQFVVQ